MNNMTRRNGNLLKGVVVAATLLCGVYFIYIYNNTSGKLKSTERIAERYRREQESLRTQLQELSSSKDDLQQRSENEKKEFINRLNTLNQHHKMLKSQHDDLQADYSRLQSEKEKDKEDVKLQEVQRNQEYMQLKQEKELEISSLRDQLANLGRDKEDLTDQVHKLATQLKESQQRLNLDQAVKRKLEKDTAALKDKFYSEQTVISQLEQRLKNLEAEKEQVRQQNLQLAQAQKQIGQVQQQAGQLLQQGGQLQQQGGQFPQQGGQQQQGLLQQNQQVQQQQQLNQVGGQQAQQNLQFQPMQGQQAGNVINPLVADNQHIGGDNLAAQQQQGVQQEMQQQQGNGEKISDNLMEQQQQQHQVQAPDLNAGQGDKNQYGALKKDGDDTNQVKVKQDVNQNEVLDAEQQQHQVAPPGEHIKGDKPDSNMAKEMDKNPFGDKNEQSKKDSNQAGELDPKGDNHVGPAPPANNNVDPPQVADNPQQNIAPPGERLKHHKKHRNKDLIDAEQEGHQVAPPGGHLNIDKTKKPNSNMADEMDKHVYHKNNDPDSNQAGEMEHDGKGKGDKNVGPAPPVLDKNVDLQNLDDIHHRRHTPSPRHAGKSDGQKAGRRPRLLNQESKFHFPRNYNK
ncbi:Golgi integral membrane protein 4-like isoform X3 [Argopecten irradians]|uniref:Golgi integral membrane protein 4-like isoform X3 n=1 Tax=Argopecten irradians TaxID=31199 RepID=UPI00371D3DFE